MTKALNLPIGVLFVIGLAGVFYYGSAYFACQTPHVSSMASLDLRVKTECSATKLVYEFSLGTSGIGSFLLGLINGVELGGVRILHVKPRISSALESNGESTGT